MLKISQELITFNNIDKKTKIHGKHISEYKGNINYKDILSEEMISILQEDNIINLILSKFNYE